MEGICPIGIFFSPVCARMHVHVSQYTCEGQRKTFRSQLFPSTLWTLRAKLRSLNLTARTLPTKPSHQPYLVLLFPLETSKEDSQKDKACDPKPQHIEGKQWSGSCSLSSPLLCAREEKHGQGEMKWAVWWNMFSQGSSPSLTGIWSMSNLKMRNRQNWSMLTPDSQVHVKKDTKKHRWQSTRDSSSALCPLVKAGLN